MLWLLIALPSLVGAALLIVGRRADRFAPSVAIGCAALTALVAGANAVSQGDVSAPFLEGITVALRVDGLSAVMIVTVTVIVLAVVVFAAGEFGPEQARARFFGFMLMFSGAMLVTVTASSLAVLLMAWEAMGAASYALIGFWWRDRERAESGTVAFLTTRTADLGLYLAAGAALAGGAGGLRLDALPTLSGGWRDAAAAGVMVAAFGKSAQLPFSFWLSRAMAGPSPVSALLHSATMVAAGAYLLLRLEPLLAATGWALTVVAWVGAATALALGAVAVCQRDLKQLLAASTCAQVGFMVLAAGVGGVAAGTAQLVAHAVTKSLLFLAAGAWLTALGTKDLDGLRGAARRYPVVGVTFTVGALSLAGIPPLSLWAAKDEVFAAVRHDSVLLYLVGLAASAVSAVYAGRALALVWSPSLPGVEQLWDIEEVGTRSVTRRERLPLIALGVGAIALGAVAWPRVRTALLDTVAVTTSPGPTWWEYATSGTIAIIAVAVTAAFVARRGDLHAPAFFAGWLGLETLARTTVTAPVSALAAALARFDDRVVAGGVRAIADGGMWAARGTNARGERSFDAVVRAIARGARALGRLARRPQTGQLHQYYAQAMVALVVLATVLLVLG